MTTTNNSDVQHLFDRWANQGRGNAMAAGHWPAVAQIIEKMKLAPGQQVLDIGCGNGYAVRAMAARVLPDGHATGVDLSPEMVRLAQSFQQADDPVALIQTDSSETPLHLEAPQNVDFQVSPAETLPFEAGRFDHVLSVEALYYMPDPKQALQEWYRVLKPGGRVWVMVDFYRDNPYCVSWPGLLELSLCFLSEHEYRQLFDHAGFKGIKTERLYNPAPVDTQKFTPGWGYDTPEDVVDFRTRVGSLLISGVK